MTIDISKYIKSNGVDLSKESDINEAGKFYFEPNNLYSLRKNFKPESLDYLYINDINATKFHRILIKEMLIYCKVNGNIIIKIKNNGLLKFDDLIKEINLCIIDKGEILEQDKNSGIFVIRKKKHYLEKDDSINKWTFGIITNGKKNDWVEKQIESIKSQKIPHYEIIVCGTYFDRKEKNFRYISFNEKDDLGWITRKKNLICGAAKYENLIILHDRIVLDKGWYGGMKRYGNYFEVLSCQIHNENGERCGDWMTFGSWFGRFARVGLLDYKDWDKCGFLDGSMYILKKSIWRRIKWDEKLFWNQAEDAKLSNDWYKNGIISRFNDFSSCLTLSWRHGTLPLYKFNNQKLSEYPGTYDFKDRIKFYVKKILNYGN